MPAGSFPAFVAEYPRVQQSLGATASQVMGTGVFDSSAGAAVFWFYDHSRGLLAQFGLQAKSKRGLAVRDPSEAVDVAVELVAVKGGRSVSTRWDRQSGSCP